MYLLFQIWNYFLVFFVGVTLIPGIQVQRGFEGYLISGLIYSVLILIVPRVIEYFKLNVNIWSFILIGTLMSVGYFYVMRYILLGFLTFTEFTIDSSFLGFDLLTGLYVAESQVLFYSGIILIILQVFNQWLLEKI